jgi:hypothetical protein
MAVVQTMDKYAFFNAFNNSSRKDQFSNEALEAIFEYMEEYSDSTGENVEFDIVGICCEWAEMTWQEVAMSYGVDLSFCDTDEERIDAVKEYLQDETHSVHLSDDSFVFVQF